MGNTGRPSTGCQTCRNRRIKCDERKPTCRNCQKGARPCPGYRDPSDAIFKDQNQLAKKLALEDHWKRLNAHQSRNSSAMTKPLAVDPDKLVLALFLESLAGGDRDAEGRESLLAITPAIYTPAGSSSPCIPAIVAMAWFTNAPFATLSQRLDAARRKYGEAMLKLQNALRDPRTAKTDDILFTVLLMRMLEIPTATSHVMPTPFKHIYGAMTLVNLRGLENFSSDVAIRLFGYIKVALTSLPGWSKIKHVSFSEEIIEANRSYALRCEFPTLSTRLGNIALEISILRAKLHNTDPTHSKAEYLYDLIQQSRILDQHLIAWRNSVPKEWETFSLIHPEERTQPITDVGSACAPYWLDYAASYPDPSKAKWLNHFRCQSIINQSIIIHCANKIARYHPAERSALDQSVPEDLTTAHSSSTTSKALDTIKTLVDGICASVPYHLDKSPVKGCHNAISPVLSSNSLMSTRPAGIAPRVPPDIPNGPADLKPSARAIALLHPLIVARRAPGILADRKEWIQKIVLAISSHFGVDESMVEKKLNSSISL
ncbi:hypothetical protein BDR22DRAFT_887210 [Usnea florida]